MNDARAFALLVLASACALRTGPDAAGGEVRDFYNVVSPDGADPWVFRHTDGRYYMTATTGRDVVVRRSATLSGLGAGPGKVVWTPPPSGPSSKDLWAPELHFLSGKWYVYVAADDGENVRHRMYVLENPAADPFEGEFTLKGKLADPDHDRWAIDGTVLQVKGRLYFLWSGWEGGTNGRQNLYIAPMRDPWTLSGPRVEVARPTLDWETRGAPPAIAEGPQALVMGSKVHVVYSASGSWTDHYCLGLLTADLDADLLSPASWSKHPAPVFRSGNGVIAPGHCSFTTSPDGAEDWVVYHSARYPGAGWSRQIRAQRFGRDASGFPVFGTPAPPDVPIALPSSEPPRLRFEAEDARLASARVTRRAGASGGAGVGSIETPESAVEFEVAATGAGEHVLSVRFANDDPGKAEATHTLTVDGGPPRVVRYAYTGPDGWSNVGLRATLKAGPNRLRFAKGGGLAALDCLDVIREPGENRTP